MDLFNKPFSRLNTSCYKWDHLKEETGKTVIPFTTADSDYPTAPEIIAALKRRVEHGAFGYSYLDREYYAILQNWTKTRYGYEIEPEWVLATTGVVSSLRYAIEALTSANAKVLVYTPVYNRFYDVVKSSGRRLVESGLVLENGRYRINFEETEEFLKEGVEMIIFCSPHNPVGRVWREEEILALLELAKKYGAVFLSDEVHCDLLIGGSRFISAGRFFQRYENVLLTFAPSKTFNLAGLHLANMIVPNPEMRKRIQDFYKNLYIGPDLLAVAAAKAAYRDCAYWVDLQNGHLTGQYEFLKAFFRERLPEAAVAELEGTYLAWVDFRYLGLSSKEMAERLLDYGVSFNRGDIYGRDYDGFLRINLACSRSQLQTGLEALARFAADLKR